MFMFLIMVHQYWIKKKRAKFKEWERESLIENTFSRDD